MPKIEPELNHFRKTLEESCRLLQGKLVSYFGLADLTPSLNMHPDPLTNHVENILELCLINWVPLLFRNWNLFLSGFFSFESIITVCSLGHVAGYSCVHRICECFVSLSSQLHRAVFDQSSYKVCWYQWNCSSMGAVFFNYCIYFAHNVVDSSSLSSAYYASIIRHSLKGREIPSLLGSISFIDFIPRQRKSAGKVLQEHIASQQFVLREMVKRIKITPYLDSQDSTKWANIISEGFKIAWLI